VTLVDRTYKEAIERMTGTERLRRTLALHSGIREMLIRHERTALPDLTDRQVAVRVARRMYLSDPRVQRMLDRIEAVGG
jgi:hypothetical protein